MSLDLYVYAPEFKAGLAARVTARLADFGLVCELSPGFDFDDETHGGFLPIKMRMVSVGPESCRDTDYMTGFECGFSEFDFGKELKRVQNPPKPSFFEKLLARQTQVEARKYLADQDIDRVLQNCRRVLEINYRRLFISWAIAAVLAELTAGVVFDRESGEYLLPEAALATIPEIIADIDANDLELFEGWEEGD
ncbi:MAG: hypothetical protein LCH63_17510 [Candidatus Melainabacteria bacterium]|nr:hypothetical protein [Candidatus Melainabacteria bacterium]